MAAKTNITITVSHTGLRCGHISGFSLKLGLGIKVHCQYIVKKNVEIHPHITHMAMHWREVREK